MKSYKKSDIIYPDIESLIGKIDGWANNPDKSSTMQIGQNIPCRYWIPTIWGFDHVI